MSPDGETLLLDLVGAEVESIVFIRYYLQLTLYLPESSPRLSCYAWPLVTAPGSAARSVGDASYRDELCALIGRRVAGASVGSKTGLTLHFDAGTSLTIRPAWVCLANGVSGVFG